MTPFMPTSNPPVSNGPPSMMQPQAPTQTLPPPLSSADAYGDGGKPHRAGGWNDPPLLDPNRVPKKKKV